MLKRNDCDDIVYIGKSGTEYTLMSGTHPLDGKTYNITIIFKPGADYFWDIVDWFAGEVGDYSEDELCDIIRHYTND